MGLQGYYSLRKFNAESFLGSAGLRSRWFAAARARSTGALSAFMSRHGEQPAEGIAAEIGSMKVTEQIDALYSMANQSGHGEAMKSQAEEAFSIDTFLGYSNLEVP